MAAVQPGLQDPGESDESYSARVRHCKLQLLYALQDSEPDGDSANPLGQKAAETKPSVRQEGRGAATWAGAGATLNPKP